MSPFLGNLSFLRSLYLQENRFQGKIPLEIGCLFRLQHLNISTNSLLEGEIPANLPNSLSVIDLSDNDLVGKIPASFGSLSKLTYLDLFANKLNGGIPPSVGNLSLLQRSDLGRNSLTGSIPHSIGRIPNLQQFGVGDNKLSGIVPASLYNISTLTELIIGYNQLTGNLPQDIGLTLHNLQFINVGENQLWGPIPASFSNASRMEYLDLSGNNLSGGVPFDLGRKMKNLYFLNLGENNLGSGDASDLRFINSLTNCSKLKSLALYGNGFGGILPTTIANPSSFLNELAAGRNQLVGSIPAGIFNFINLEVIGLEDNLFSGVIPFEIGKLRNLQILTFHTNKLSGPIPESIGNLTQIFELDLDDNNLNGTIPSKYGIGGRTSTEGDIYSYGILLLEMLTGKRPTDELFTSRQSLHEFCKVALPERVMDIIDPRMLLEETTEGENDSQKERVRQDKIRECSVSLVRIGIACSAESPSERMNIKDVIIGLMTIKEVFLGVGIHGRRQMRMQPTDEGTSRE
ncbi:hypothetical protein RHSIM_Rhsim09G0173700 [Rhododendron simsii]|uniref:Uncharacterized protein n=1 Tax=Rhododendron simsii TaxID=118357 RepID=A0A834LFF7_RHOSS|nr:hypothetical protein RHSIM_Rhsim09G0173700 [Rhododendron simsii]